MKHGKRATQLFLTTILTFMLFLCAVGVNTAQAVTEGKAKVKDQCFLGNPSGKIKKASVPGVVVDLDLLGFPLIAAHVEITHRGRTERFDSVLSVDGDPSGLAFTNKKNKGTFQVHVVNHFEDIWIQMSGKYTCEKNAETPSACQIKNISANFLIVDSFNRCTVTGKYKGKTR